MSFSSSARSDFGGFVGRMPVWLLAAALALLSVSPPTQAIMLKVDPGERPKLGANEGLLLAAIDTDAGLDLVKIDRDGLNFDTRNLRKIAVGHNTQLYVVPAGRYRWASVRGVIGSQFLGMFEYKLREHPEFYFDVKPGVVNYPGDLLHRGTDWSRWYIHISNRGLLALDWLEQQHPAIFREYRFEYTGHFPDPFPQKYREAVAAGRPPEDKTAPLPEAGKLPIPIEELWRPGRLQMVELSPDGDLVAQAVATKRMLEGKDYKWEWAVDLIDMRSEKSIRLTDAPKKISRLDWADNRTLIISLGHDDEPDVLVVVTIADGPEGRKYERAFLPRPGVLMKVLRDQPGNILFTSFAPGEGLQVHKIDVRNKKALEKFKFPARERLNKGVENDINWYADAGGALRLAVARNKDGERVLMHGGGGKFREVLKLDDENDFRPMMLSADGNLIYGLSEKDRGQWDLVEFDPATSKIVRTVFSKPGVDIQWPLQNETGALVGASYYQDGLLVSHYFDEENAAIQRKLRGAFRGKSVVIMQRDRQSRYFVAAVGGSDQPYNVYYFNKATSEAMLLGETKPWLSGRRFAASETISVESKDGFKIEAYLTLPAQAQGKVPLVVFPHGGPIGVRDNRSFDPEVQFLAALGYAVLQVNFRGSEGFGTAFRKAGERNYGSAIEDDVDAALIAALAKYPIDRERMCAMGASYGGYSAMVSAIRWPGRFRCAVSMSGVSDRALVFTASDAARSEEGRKGLVRLIGDPNTDMEDMLKYSPLYRYRELDVPVMLIHGTEDLRVDYEHTRRLLRMLNLAGRPPVLIELKGEGHGIEEEDNRERAWIAIAGFLRKHLSPLAAPGQEAPAGDPRTQGDAVTPTP